MPLWPVMGSYHSEWLGRYGLKQNLNLSTSLSSAILVIMPSSHIRTVVVEYIWFSDTCEHKDCLFVCFALELNQLIYPLSFCFFLLEELELIKWVIQFSQVDADVGKLIFFELIMRHLVELMYLDTHLRLSYTHLFFFCVYHFNVFWLHRCSKLT